MHDLRHLVAVSPHLDDAVLSAGGTLHLARQSGWKITLITLFAGDAIEPLTVAAERLHRLWNLGTDAPAARRLEDLHAARTLNADTLHCSLPDAAYRAGSENVFRRQLNPRDSELLNESVHLLASILTQLAPTSVIGPSGVGHHIDHILTARACDRVESQREQKITRWLDQPYSWNGPVATSFNRVDLVNSVVEAKIESINCYASQLSIVFDCDDESWRKRVRQSGRAEYFSPAPPPVN